MGQDSKIEWTHHTFNPWWGCTKVSDGCKNCYAETLSNRYGHNIWGVNANRRFFGDKHWDEPLKWERDAKKAGERRRVFCGSMCDVFEDRGDLIPHRIKLFTIIRNTPYLDWLLLTKRPENIVEMTPLEWDAVPPSNVWFGTSCENQKQVDIRIPELLKVPAVIRFLSCEPLLGPIDLKFFSGDILDYKLNNLAVGNGPLKGIDWVIVGGESGPGKRPMDTNWARSIHGQCEAAGVAFFMKQVDKVKPIPEDLMIRQFPLDLL